MLGSGITLAIAALVSAGAVECCLLPFRVSFLSRSRVCEDFFTEVYKREKGELL